MTDAIVADANPLLSALLGGRARDVLFSPELVFYSPQHTLFEVEKYLPKVAHKIGQRDPKDVHVLALALQLDSPIWSEDRDFEGLPDVEVHRTADMLTMLGA